MFGGLMSGKRSCRQVLYLGCKNTEEDIYFIALCCMVESTLGICSGVFKEQPHVQYELPSL